MPQTLPITVDDGSFTEACSLRCRKDIPAHNLGKTFEVTITTGNGSATMNLSALSYVKIAFDAFTDANAKNAMAAIYTCAKAAEAFKSGN